MGVEVQTVVVVDDDPIVADGVAVGIARAGRRVIVCRDIECARLVMELEPVNAVIADIQFRGDFSFDGLDFVDFVKKELPGTPIFLMTGAGYSGLEKEAERRGASGFFRKPFSVTELEECLPSPLGASAEGPPVNVPELDQLIEERLIHTRFQPVVRLDDGEPIGFESLARPVTETLFQSPEVLFRYASRTDRTIELEEYCLSRSIEAAANLPKGRKLFLNIHPSSLERRSIVSIIERRLSATGFDPRDVVLEITEQGEIESGASLEQISALKEMGVEFALDDIGIAFSHLPYIEEIEPSWMKISQYFGSGFEADETKNKIVRNVASLAFSFEAKFILEGIETEETAEAARRLGIEYGQGYLYA
ncbi:MAG: EAL domain-containing response regulator, partial [Thermoanaerobaculia bacterium]|nr:EAL domain-containing response regulator [Thermoanaerobaculia bacterium]